MTTRYRHTAACVRVRKRTGVFFPSALAVQPSETVSIRLQRRGVGGGTPDELVHAGPQPGGGIWSSGSADVDVGDSGGGETQGSAGGVGEAGQHVEGGQAAAAFDAAIEDWVVPMRLASSVWVRPARVRRA
jgi:hypothetical protein